MRVSPGGSTIGLVSEMKYLGIIVDKNLKFHTHVRAVCERVKKMIVAFRKNIHVT